MVDHQGTVSRQLFDIRWRALKHDTTASSVLLTESVMAVFAIIRNLQQEGGFESAELLLTIMMARLLNTLPSNRSLPFEAISSLCVPDNATPPNSSQPNGAASCWHAPPYALPPDAYGNHWPSPRRPARHADSTWPVPWRLGCWIPHSRS